MTYQELLDEFCKRRAAVANTEFPKLKIETEVETLEWAMQSILEKLRDTQEGPQ